MKHMMKSPMHRNLTTLSPTWGLDFQFHVMAEPGSPSKLQLAHLVYIQPMFIPCSFIFGWTCFPNLGAVTSRCSPLLDNAGAFKKYIYTRPHAMLLVSPSPGSPVLRETSHATPCTKIVGRPVPKSCEPLNNSQVRRIFMLVAVVCRGKLS